LAPGGAGFGLIGLDELPTGRESEVLKELYLREANSTLFRVKLAAHNLATAIVGGRAVTKTEIVTQLSKNTEFRLTDTILKSNINKVNGNFVIGGVESTNYLARTTTHHEMLHMGQYLRNPKIKTTGFWKYAHEVAPAYIGTPEIFGTATAVGMGITYGTYELAK